MAQIHPPEPHDVLNLVAPRDVGYLFGLLTNAMRVLAGAVIGFTIGIVLGGVVKWGFLDTLIQLSMWVGIGVIIYAFGALTGMVIRRSLIPRLRIIF